MRARLGGLFLLFAALASSSLAQDRRGGPSLDRVLPEISRSVPGTFYDAEGPFLTPDGQASYRIKWMTPDGRIIWLSVNAHTGQVIGRGGPPGNAYRGYENRNDDRDRPRMPPRSNWRDDGGNDWNRGGQDWNRDRDRQDSNRDRQDRDRERPDWNRNHDRPDWNRDRQDWNRQDWNRRPDWNHNRSDWGNGGRDRERWNGGGWNGNRDRGPDRRHGG